MPVIREKSNASRLSQAFQSAKNPLLVACTVAGDPDYEASIRLVFEMEAAGADCIELVMPFSDPVADGPVIQEAISRALQAGMDTDRLFSQILEIREKSKIPLVILTYANIVIQRGIRKFYQDAANAGADGVAVADVPLEEAAPFCTAARDAGIEPILFVSQTTSPERIGDILEMAGGFIYLIAAMGVTGVRDELSPEVLSCIREVKERTSLPVVPGFGISTPEHIRAYTKAGADGMIVGSAIVRIIGEQSGGHEEMRIRVGALVRNLKEASEEDRGMNR